jgi:hypothetical protein
MLTTELTTELSVEEPIEEPSEESMTLRHPTAIAAAHYEPNGMSPT